MKYLITGGSGQLGREMEELLKEQQCDFTSYNSSDLNILDKNKIEEVFERDQPDVVIHCAAYTAVDKAEEDEMNGQVNVEGTRNIAEACKKHGALMIYISTDYVFDGTSEKEYKETDQTNPLNAYGKAKLKGEQIVREILERYYIVRTSWVFGQYGNNFVSTMKRLAKEKSELSIVSDQIGRPTWTRTLAEFVLHLATKQPEHGVYHLANEGSCSWFEFAEEILKYKTIEVKPILSKDYPQKANRPKNSVLSLEKAKQTGFSIIDWKVALKQYNKSIE